MALLTPPLIPLLSPSRHRVSSPSLLAAGAVPSHLICLFPHSHRHHDELCPSGPNVWPLHRRRRRGAAASLDQEDWRSLAPLKPQSLPRKTQGHRLPLTRLLRTGVATSAEPADARPEDLENIREIKRVR
ncbi:protein CHLOROPLAST ENHANCING STRESS TOLERANCE, chloroplastic-like [Miscanthus floridulus]|uniref:protein CHLOROPLAST ENHANCING STRESS TOLERANCE, chloroplastic-like n=1 Tax=Miscanthus floridulus TaxID=154761 RepID=UPI00345AF4D0